MLCSQCQYDLDNPVPERCPLCGYAIPEAQRKQASAAGKGRQNQDTFWVLLAIGCAAIGVALACLLWALEQKQPALVNAPGIEPMVSPEDRPVTTPALPAELVPETRDES